MSPVSLENEYSKNDKLKREDVQNLLNWVEKQPHLPKITELQAIIFLVRCKYSNELAKKRIDLYFTLKNMLPELYKNRHEIDPKIYAACTITVLPKVFEKSRILYAKFNKCDFTTYNFVGVSKIAQKTIELDLHKNGSCDGYIIFLDAQDSDMRHFFEADLVKYRKTINFARKAYLVKITSMHMINQPPFISKLMALSRQFLSEKLMNKLYFHKNLASLHEAIPKEYLPDEYGGNVGSIAKIKEQQMRDLVENGDLFKMDEKQVADESKREAKMPKDVDEIFGTAGTYKTINLID